MKTKLFILAILCSFLFILSSCENNKEYEYVENCGTYQEFIQTISPDLYRHVINRGYNFNEENYYELLPRIKELQVITEIHETPSEGNTGGLFPVVNKQQQVVTDETVSPFDLSGIGCFPYIKKLTLQGGGIKDIVPLKDLVRLEHLEIVGTQVNNLESLSTLSKIRTLVIQQNDFLESTRGIEELTTINYLDLSNNQIKSIIPLQGLNQLNTLIVQNSGLDFNDLEEFSGFQSVTYLDISNNNLCETKAIGTLSNLEYLDISRNDLYNRRKNASCEVTSPDFSFVYDLNQLETLKSANNQIQSLDWVSSIDNTNLYHMDLSNNRIESLDPLFNNPSLQVGLKILSLSNNQIRSVENIHRFDLTHLYIDQNKLKSIDSVFQLFNLIKLDASNNEITSIKDIRNLNQLEKLYLSYNLITKVNNLENKKLQTIDLSNNKIEDIDTSFNNMPLLRDLNLTSNMDGNVIETISHSFNACPFLIFNEDKKEQLDFNFKSKDLKIIQSFNNMKQFNSIYIHDQGINSIDEGSFRLRNVEKVYAYNNALKDMRWLNNLPELKRVQMFKNQISTLEGLEEETLKELIELNLSYNQISDAEILRNLAKIEHLDLSFNQLKTLDFVENLKTLELLSISNNQITDISKVNNLEELETLYLEDNQITEINGLNNLIYLKYLELRGNPIKKINGLNNIRLDALNLSHCQIEEITKDSFIKSNIKRLDLSHNSIKDLSFTVNLKYVMDINLSHNLIMDTTPLDGLSRLTTLNLEGNEITELSGINYMDNLGILVLPNTITSYKNTLNHVKKLSLVNGESPSLILNKNIVNIDNSFNSIKFSNIIFPEGFGKGVRIEHSFYYVSTIDFSQTTFTDIGFIEYMAELTSIVIHNNESILEIKDIDTVNLSKLTKISILDSNVHLIDHSFNECKSLTSVTVKSDLEKLVIKDSFNHNLNLKDPILEGNILMSNSFIK